MKFHFRVAQEKLLSKRMKPGCAKMVKEEEQLKFLTEKFSKSCSFNCYKRAAVCIKRKLYAIFHAHNPDAG